MAVKTFKHRDVPVKAEQFLKNRKFSLFPIRTTERYPIRGVEVLAEFVCPITGHSMEMEYGDWGVVGPMGNRYYLPRGVFEATFLPYAEEAGRGMGKGKGRGGRR